MNGMIAWAQRRIHCWLMVVLLSVALVIAGCEREYADPATLAASLKPATVFAELSSATTLTAAAAQFATALNIDPTAVRVRIKPGNCTVCSLESRPEMASVAGIAVDEAEAIVEPNDEVSFFIPNFSCTFLYDGATLTPRQCQPTPI